MKLLLRFVFLFLISSLIFINQGTAGENRLSIGGGVFYPNSDDLKTWDNGSSVTLSYSRRLAEKFCIHIDISSFNTEKERALFGILVEGTIQTVGLELLGVFSHRTEKIEIYLGGGLGIYRNEINLSVTDGIVKYTFDGEGRGTGGVLKTGLRYSFTERFFAGILFKVFVNNQEIVEYTTDGYNIYKIEETLDLGGSILNFEAGFIF
ncbi:hypothetical protein [Persephonella sp.]